MIPPTRADDDELARLAERDAKPAPAARRPARPAGRQPDRRAPPARARRAGTGPTRCAPGWRRSSTTRSAAPAPRSRSFPTATTRPRTCWRTTPGGEPRDIRLRVTARIEGDRLTLDFTGTDPQVEGNLNCPLSVTKSAAFFAVRVLTDPDAPPSAGAFRPVEVIAPEGCLLNARPPAAVAAGNVETSSRVADLVIDGARRRPRRRPPRARGR